ncbi:hypothetical protein [Aquirufa sp.]|jgi:hypothetical protein|uniref:hypothetical protein n=1 Tax=Aquirufa sp. TaxID=2676249 RepID=UPI0037C0E84D
MLPSSRQYFLLLFIFIALSAHAQIFSWRDPNNSTCYKIDFVTNRCYVSNSKGLWQDIGNINLQDIKSADLFSNADAINPVKVPGKKGTYLLMECSGQVYIFEPDTRTLKREDLTFYRGANCQAVQFNRNGTFYSFGGYGFWQSTNIITQYNSVSKDWTHILAQGKIPNSIHKKSAAYLPDLDKFIVVGSKRINQTESAEALDVDFGIFDYNFTDKVFKRLGEVYEPVLRTILAGEKNNFTLAMGQYIVISPYNTVPGYNHDLLYIIDTKDSYKGYLWTNPARFQIRKFMEDRGVLYSVFTRGNSIFLPQAQETFPYGSYQVAEVSAKTLLAESKPLGPIMEKTLIENVRDFVLIIIVVIVFFIVARFFILLKQRRKKSQLNLLLGANERQFLDFLRLNYRQGYVSGHQIVAFFGRHKSSPESQRQFRAKLIDGLTKSLGLIYPGQQILDIQADDKDQRMLTYRLTAEIFEELKKL